MLELCVCVYIYVYIYMYIYVYICIYIGYNKGQVAHRGEGGQVELTCDMSENE